MSRLLAILVLVIGFSLELDASSSIVTDSLELEFSYDGRLVSAIACFPSRLSENARCQQFSDSGVVDFAGGDSSWKETSDHTDSHFVLAFESLAGESITWRVPLQGYRIELAVTGLEGIELTSGDAFRPRPAAGFGNWLEQARYVDIRSGEVTQTGFDEQPDDSEETPAPVEWSGFRNRFWALMARPAQPAQPTRVLGENVKDARVGWSWRPGGRQEISIYLGPVNPEPLSLADDELQELMYAGLWFWLRWICFALYYLLSWISAILPSWGLAIMVLSLAVHVLMLPLSRLAERFQQQVHATEARLAPEMHRIKSEYKGEEQSRRILELYKTEKVHPLYSLKSLLGVAVVIPIFIGAFDMLAENIHLLEVSFLWIADLSRSDAIAGLPFSIPFFGSELNLLPFLMTVLSVAASALHNPPAQHPDLRRKQLRNMVLMALAFFALFYTFPAGMVLYWTTNNLISVIKSAWVRR